MLSILFPRAHSRYSALPILGRVLDPLCKWLASQGYPSNAIRRRVASARLLESALNRGAISMLENRTAAELRACFPRSERWTAQNAYSLGRSLLKFLEDRGELAVEHPTATSLLLAGYKEYLRNVRGLSIVTVNKHAAIANEFLGFLDHDHQPAGLRDLGVRKIDAFLAKASRHRGRISMMDVTVILRSFLRFLATQGIVRGDLAANLESPRHYRGERLPRALPWETVQTLLDSIDRSTQKGRRDFAMLLLIATYGLRIGEVAALALDDIAWRDRRIRVPRPKIGTSLDFPLTDEVASALLDYLRNSRPKSNFRQVFLRVRIPIGPIFATAITDVFEAWTVKAKISLPQCGGPHCLRHSLAMHLLRQGTPLKTIGDMLGHRNAESTGIYLRLDLDDLRDVALPLPPATFREGQP